MFKFKLNQTVYYMVDNRMHSAPILSRMIIENYFANSEINTVQQKKSFARFGFAEIKYATTHGEYLESELFESKEALAEYIIKDQA